MNEKGDARSLKGHKALESAFHVEGARVDEVCSEV